MKGRLESSGAEVVVVSSKRELPAAGDSFDLAITDSKIPDSVQYEHIEFLKRQGLPIWLWSDDAVLLEDPQKLLSLGIEKSFRKLNRADLILEFEASLKNATLPGDMRKNFLLVEDSATVRAYVRKVLGDSFPSSEIIEAADGKAAISAMKTNRIDLIVTDLQMPGMDGASFVQVLRNNSVLAKKPIIILSGTMTDETREKMAGMPLMRLLAKPASPEALEEAVRALLKGEGVKP